MDENRRFFRIKNKGDIRASSENKSLDVIDISSSGVLIIKKNSALPKAGTLELNIRTFSLKISYEILRIEKEMMVLGFNNKEEMNTLFLVLKHLRDEQKNGNN
jgi:hypothetical protein